jgi:hypothetical protein
MSTKEGQAGAPANNQSRTNECLQAFIQEEVIANVYFTMPHSNVQWPCNALLLVAVGLSDMSVAWVQKEKGRRLILCQTLPSYQILAASILRVCSTTPATQPCYAHGY